MQTNTLDTESSTAPSNDLQLQRVLVTGSTGMVGQRLISRLGRDGKTGIRLGRGAGADGEATWDPARDRIDLGTTPFDAVVHLAGENIAEGRWSKRKMDAIRSSRVNGTRLLSETLARQSTPPKTLVSASAIGFYGDRGDTQLSEDAAAGSGFLPEVCVEWENATQAARDAGIRVVNLRIGVVLDRDGGALAKMLTPFKLGFGGKIGSGKQYMSWITTRDLVSTICTVMEDERYEGPTNAVAPQPVTNLEFTRTLGKVLSRPTIAPMPAFAARLAFGRMADALLLSSARVVPTALQERGFEFADPTLESALRAALQQA